MLSDLYRQRMYITKLGTSLMRIPKNFIILDTSLFRTLLVHYVQVLPDLIKGKPLQFLFSSVSLCHIVLQVFHSLHLLPSEQSNDPIHM